MNIILEYSKYSYPLITNIYTHLGLECLPPVEIAPLHLDTREDVTDPIPHPSLKIGDEKLHRWWGRQHVSHLLQHLWPM